MAFAFFFPGQGSQSLHMMDGFEGIHVVRDTFQEASDVLGEDLWALVNGEDAAALNTTTTTQPLMLTAGIATWRAYQQAGGVLPSVLAGHSLGEYTALVAAESLDFATAVKLVRERATLMQNAVPQGVGAMAAILGLDDAQVIAVCEQAAQGEVVQAVNFNAIGQVVIAGHAQAVERAMVLAKEAGAKRALPLPVSVPSHCALMQPAAEQLAAYLQNIDIQTPKIKVLHNVDVQSHVDAAAIKDALVRQLYSPVLWTQTVNQLVVDGITQAAECGPGKVLAGLSKRINKEASCVALTKQADIDAFIAAQ
ncbi:MULTISPECIES: ACP S-malonyltransferase [Vitreoscilla]|uniref:Malonyl CoA-acyl carrier protein transacylase n=1 Tax=Vitreoscilla stercoraria TaxID=61 RepID=A0ABY4ECZ0_VITST|nr:MULTISPECIES: ACP S-malonyltransferase [Vitreoscilla]AUZ05507.1 malonyl CoA-acyl carrier protein transacylase [Vitreoscilla sp. C1]UOO93079.1 ACP S-malonyltransferase [Vitreoscilla stercoraria]